MHGQERCEAAAGAERAGGARRSGPPGERRELAVCDDLASRHRAEGAGAVAVEPVVEAQRHVRELVLDAGEERGEPSGQRVACGRARAPRALWTRELAVEDAVVLVEPHLAHAPA